MSISQRQRPLYEVKANLFKGLAHPFRIRILELLSVEPEVSVAALQAATGLEASHLSQHLSVLRRHRLVVSERRASHVFYRLTDPAVARLLATARELLLEVVADDGALLIDAHSLPRIPEIPRAAEIPRLAEIPQIPESPGSAR
jgi:DNA-binding transcriptional ArsR family regulator